MAAKPKNKKAATPNIGIKIEGSKAELETATSSIVTVLESVESTGLDSSVAVAAMRVLEMAVEGRITNHVSNCNINMRAK